MYNNIKKYIARGALAVFALALLAAAPAVANATVTWNNWQADCPTVMIGNYSTGTGLTPGPCWTTATQATPGQTVNVRLYYHNTGDTTSNPTILRVTNPTGQSNNFTFTGSVNNTAVRSATLSLSAPSTLTFSQVKWYPDKAYNTPTQLPNGQTGIEILQGNGLNLGSIAPWTSCAQGQSYCHSGSVVVSFVVNQPQQSTSCSILDFKANPTSVQAGGASTLSWVTSNCANVTLTGGNLSGSVAVNGNRSTGSLSSTTTYTLAATGSNGTVTRNVTVNVNQAQQNCSILDFKANPTSVAVGSSSMLSWVTSNCSNVTLSGGSIGGNVSLQGNRSTGVLSQTTSYTLAATGSNGTVTRNVTVNVNQSQQQCVINNFSANPTLVQSGSSSTLAWSTANCNNVTIVGGNLSGQRSAAGTVSTGPLSNSTTFTITASNNVNTVSQSVTVSVNAAQQCSIGSFYASPTVVTNGGSSTLYWTTTNCNSVTVTGPNVYSQSLSGSVNTGSIYGSNTYTITAYGNNTVTQSVTVSANQVQQCVINSFYATSSEVASGGSTTLYWSVTGNGSVLVTGPGVYSTQSSGSVTTGAIYSTSTFTITANCSNSVSQTVVVSVAQPTNLTPITTVATNVTGTSARLNGLIPATPQIAGVQAFFEYGTTPSLGFTTNSQYVGAQNSTNYFSTVSTTPNTTYYYRAAATYNGVTTYGQIVSFRTGTNTVIVNTGTNTNTTVTQVLGTGIGFGSPLVMLTINDQMTSIMQGDLTTYVVTYKNITALNGGTILTNATINVILPAGVSFRGTSLGVLTTDNTVAASVGTLLPQQEGSFTIQVQVNETVAAGSSLVATANLAFTLPSGAQDSAVAYDLNTVGPRNNYLTGLALWGGFFPGTFLGWIILLGIILLIILLARYLSRRNHYPVAPVVNNYQHVPPAAAPRYDNNHYPNNLPH